MHLVCGYCSFTTITHWPLKRASEGALSPLQVKVYLLSLLRYEVMVLTSYAQQCSLLWNFWNESIYWQCRLCDLGRALETSHAKKKKSRDSLNIFCNLQTDILWRLCAISVQFLLPVIWCTLNRNFYSSPVIFQHRLKERPCILRTYNEHFKLSCPEAIALAKSELSHALKLRQKLPTRGSFSTVASSKRYEQREFSLCFFTSAGFLLDSIAWSSRTFPGGLRLLCTCSAHPYKGYRNCVVFR